MSLTKTTQNCLQDSQLQFCFLIFILMNISFLEIGQTQLHTFSLNHFPWLPFSLLYCSLHCVHFRDAVFLCYLHLFKYMSSYWREKMYYHRSLKEKRVWLGLVYLFHWALTKIKLWNTLNFVLTKSKIYQEGGKIWSKVKEKV